MKDSQPDQKQTSKYSIVYTVFSFKKINQNNGAKCCKEKKWNTGYKDNIKHWSGINSSINWIWQKSSFEVIAITTEWEHYKNE